MLIHDNWMRRLPAQFQNKKNIDIFIQVWSEELEEVKKVFEDLKNINNIDQAIGKNLDRMGDIAVLSRLDAFNILRQRQNIVVDDRIYRQALKYKILQNTSTCTYYDLMESMSLLWDTKNIRYYEDSKRPASINIGMQCIDVDDKDPVQNRILAVKPAGVELLYDVNYGTAMEIKEKVNLNKLVLTYQFYFWNTNFFNGAFTFDGTRQWNAVRVQHPLRLTIGISIKNTNQAKISDSVVKTSLRSSVKTDERISVNIVCETREVILNNNEMDVALSLYSFAQNEERYINASITTKKNLNIFDGVQTFDGSIQFNAMRNKEMI